MKMLIFFLLFPPPSKTLFLPHLNYPVVTVELMQRIDVGQSCEYGLFVLSSRKYCQGAHLSYPNIYQYSSPYSTGLPEAAAAP